MDTHVVIMAGGVGSRLWPISTPEMPKQFIDVLGVGKSMIQMTVDRFLPIAPKEKFWVVTSGKYVDIVRKQLPDIPEEQILAEPEPRNTAPCIAYACWKIAKKFPDANIIVTPSDAFVMNTLKFAELINTAVEAVDETDKIITIGIRPTRPETGYGYIYSNEEVGDSVAKVNSFKEKPDKKTAMDYFNSGRYFWNAGIFVWNVKTVMSQMWKYSPQIAAIMDQLSHSLYTPFENVALMELFPQCNKISIDYAVMEKSDNIYIIAGDIGWSDLGTWGSVKEHIDADSQGNAYVGSDIRLFDCKDCVIHAEDAKSVVVEGLEGYIVSVRSGNVLVCKISEEQNIRTYARA